MNVCRLPNKDVPGRNPVVFFISNLEDACPIYGLLNYRILLFCLVLPKILCPNKCIVTQSTGPLRRGTVNHAMDIAWSNCTCYPGPPLVIAPFRIMYRVASEYATCPCIWCRALTTCRFYIDPIFDKAILIEWVCKCDEYSALSLPIDAVLTLNIYFIIALVISYSVV